MIIQGNKCLDYSRYLTVPFLIYFFKNLDRIEDGGYQMRNVELCKWGRELLVKEWNTSCLVEDVECAMCAIRIPYVFGTTRQPSPEELAGLKEFVQVPNFLFDGIRYVRISCHVYNTREDLQVLAKAMLDLCGDCDGVVI
jgi:selenocysteine lyase/cysteine desulfurase